MIGGGVACGVGVGTTGATGWTVLPPQAAARSAAPNVIDLKRRLMLTSFPDNKKRVILQGRRPEDQSLTTFGTHPFTLGLQSRARRPVGRDAAEVDP
jgi:hypothetical protein